MWVVASIHRAVDDRTAKELLGEHFRRQLLMDGQYGAISFVCTKTDILVPSEIIRCAGGVCRSFTHMALADHLASIVILR